MRFSLTTRTTVLLYAVVAMFCRIKAILTWRSLPMTKAMVSRPIAPSRSSGNPRPAPYGALSRTALDLHEEFRDKFPYDKQFVAAPVRESSARKADLLTLLLPAIGLIHVSPST